MHTVVPRCPVHTRFLVLLLCVSLGVLVLHTVLGPALGIKLALVSALAELPSADHAPASADETHSKKSSWKPSPIFEGIAKLHFIVGLGMFLFIALMVVEDDLMKRALLLVPIVLLFWGSKVLFAIDQANMAADMMRHYKPK